jgi:16S rRNA G966 N2-methylase RsmD
MAKLVFSKNEVKFSSSTGFTKAESYGSDDSLNKFFFGDNLSVMQYLLDNGYEGRFDLIYIDPPFFSYTGY